MEANGQIHTHATLLTVTHSTAVGPNASPDASEKRNLVTLTGIKPRPWVVQSTAKSLYRLICPGSLALKCKLKF
jgi:hypothetical protein